MKVHTLLDAIHDPLLEHAKLKVLGDEQLMNNYNETISYIKVALNSYQNRSTRQLSAVNTRGFRGGRFGNRGGGRSSGRGRGGRFGRGGRGSNKSTSKPADVFDPKDPGKSLSNAAWAALTDEQRALAREARQKKSKKRNVSAMSTAEETKTEEQPSSEQTSTSQVHFKSGDQITRRKI